MTPQELKNSILELAIEGKLVPQLKEDGTTEDFLICLEDFKRKQKNYKKIKSRTEDEDAIYGERFEIPSNWSWVYLTDVYYLLPTGVNNYEGNKKYFSTGSIVNNVFTPEGEYSYKDRPSRANREHQIGDLLDAKMQATVKTFIVDKTNCDALFSTGFFGLRAFLGNTNFLKWLVQSPYFQKLKDQNCNGTTQKALSDEKLKFFRIALPPLEEQKRIVAKIEEVFPLIDKYEEAWTRLEKFNNQFPVDMEKSIMKSAITGKLTFQSIHETSINYFETKEICDVNDMFFNIPNNWCWVKLNSVCTFKGGFAYKSTDYVEHSNNYLMRLGNVKNNHLVFGDKSCYLSDSLAKKTENFKIFVDDILITMTGTRGKGDYFYSKLIDNNDLINKNLYLNQRVGCLRHNNKIIPKYLLFVLQSEFVRNRIFEKETGTANQGNIGSNDIMNYIYIPVPPLEEQKRIVAKIEELLPLCNSLKQ